MGILATAADGLLTSCGPFGAHVPGWWRIVRRLEPLARDTWDRTRLVPRDGILYELDLRDIVPRSICYNGCYEPAETRFARSTIRPGFTAVDVGSHIGYFALHFSRWVGRLGRVYAFEPSPTTHARLLRNLDLNRADNVRPVQAALGDRVAHVSMDTHTNANTGHFSVSGDGSIAMLTFDEFVSQENLSRLDFIKVDAEGCEVRFLIGAERALSRFRPVLLMEINPESLATFGHSAEELRDRLRSHGYLLYRPTRRGLQALDRLPVGCEYVNIAALPESR